MKRQHLWTFAFPALFACANDTSHPTGTAADAVDSYVGTWVVVGDTYPTSTCPMVLDESTGGYFVVEKSGADSAFARFCNDEAGTQCIPKLSHLAVQAQATEATLDLSYDFATTGFDCTVSQMATGRMTTGGDLLTVWSTGTMHVKSGTECGAAEAHLQSMNHNSFRLDGCVLSEIVTFERVP